MKVHPAPKKRNLTLLRYDVASPTAAHTVACRNQKKLRRLPHIFAKVLELPFHSDCDVSIEETAGFFRFTVPDADIGPDVRADPVQIHPGVTKITVQFGLGIDVSMTGLELDLWRFRLPGSTRPDLASASYEDGDLVVVVPKGVNDDVEEREGWGDGQGNLVLVQ